jgi:hypothetical protein
MACLGDHAVDNHAAMALKNDHLAGWDGTVRAPQIEQVAGLHAGEHAAAGHRKTSLAERSEDFGGQVEFEGFYQSITNWCS